LKEILEFTRLSDEELKLFEVISPDKLLGVLEYERRLKKK
jgi:hypothetical protein